MTTVLFNILLIIIITIFIIIFAAILICVFFAALRFAGKCCRVWKEGSGSEGAGPGTGA